MKNSYCYDPYGTSLNKSEKVSNPWQFTSGYFDTNTGLYKFGTRYYDPQVSRWMQKDPIGGSLGNVNSTNPYVYANNLPNMLVDPSGREGILEVFASCLSTPVSIVAGFLGFLGGAVAAVLAFISIPAAAFAAGVVLGIALSFFLYCIAFTIGYFAAPRPAQ